MERYRRLGQEPVVSILPKSKVGNEVAVGPAIDHTAYLKAANTGSHRERFRDNALATFTTGNGGIELITIPRSSYVEAPGSLHLMLVAVETDRRARERSIPAFADISDEQGREHFSLLARIAAELPGRYGNRWFIGTSINPDEWNRQAVQSVKTIHTHVVAMKGEEFVSFAEMQGKERAEKRRALADSATSLGNALLRETVFTPQFWERDEAGIVSERDVRIPTQYPKGYTFAIPSIEAIGDPQFAALTKTIDELIRAAYRDLSRLFTEDGARDVLGRPVLRPARERATRIYAYASQKGLSITTYKRLMGLSRLLVSGLEEVSKAGNDIDSQIYRRNTRLFLKGRAYNHMIFPSQDGPSRVLVSVVPRALSGGSPLDAMGIYKDQYLTDGEVVKGISKRHRTVAEEILSGVLV